MHVISVLYHSKILHIYSNDYELFIIVGAATSGYGLLRANIINNKHTLKGQKEVYAKLMVPTAMHHHR